MDGVENLQNFSKCTARHTTHHEISPCPDATQLQWLIVVFLCHLQAGTVELQISLPLIFVPTTATTTLVLMPPINDGMYMLFMAKGRRQNFDGLQERAVWVEGER